MVRALVLLALAGCQALTFNQAGRPCDSQGRCLEGYSCHPVSNRCELIGTGGACTASTEIACNGVDEDCDGADLIETGTLQNCAGCTDSCDGDNVALQTCEASAGTHVCFVRRCEAGFIDADGDPKNGCESQCTNIDGDNVCDDADTCIDVDGDGRGAGAACAADSDDANPNVCADTDLDTCDDCSSGSFDPMMDGVDLNGDGTCHNVQADEDGDSVPWASGDPNDGNPNICGTGNGEDSCDDCSAAELVDCDMDDICDTDPREVGDIDGDGVESNASSVDLDPDDCVATTCGDIDSDGCDDCSKFALYGRQWPADDGLVDLDRDGICGDNPGGGNAARDCDDTIPTCADNGCLADVLPGGGNNNPGKPRCLVRWCLATLADPLGKNVNPDAAATPACHVVKTRAELNTALGTTAPVYVLFSLDVLPGAFDLTNAQVDMAKQVIMHQRAGVRLESPFGGSVLRPDTGSDGTELHELVMRGTSVGGNYDAGIRISSANVVVNGCDIEDFDARGIIVEGSGDIIANNRVAAPRNAYAKDTSVGNIVLNGATNAQVYNNVIELRAPAGIVVQDATAPAITHNTIFARRTDAVTEGESLLFVGTGTTQSTDVCARDNVLIRDNNNSNGSKELVSFGAADSATFNATCVGNYTNHHGVNQCDDVCDSAADMEDCACLPAPFFHALPDVTLADFDVNLCPINPVIIDVISQTTAPSRRGPRVPPADMPYFLGTAADAGAREATSIFCPTVMP